MLKMLLIPSCYKFIHYLRYTHLSIAEKQMYTSVVWGWIPEMNILNGKPVALISNKNM